MALDLDPQSAASWGPRLTAGRREGLTEDVIAQGSVLARRARSKGWPGPLADVLCILGHAAMDLGDLDRAQLWFDESLHHAGADTRRQANAFRGVAHLWELRGETRRFREAVAVWLDRAKACESALLVGEALTARGRLRIAEGDLQGEDDMIRAAVLFAADDEPIALVRTLLNRLPLALQRRDATAARALMDEAIAGLATVKDPQLEAQVALDNGEVARLEGDLAGAHREYKRSLDLLGDNHPTARVARINLALTDLAAGDLTAAAEAIPALLESTRGHPLLTGITHLLGLAIGPTSRRDSEDAVWSRHGTPARLSLQGYREVPDVLELAEIAVRRMVKRADAIQAGRAAIVMGLATETPDPDLLVLLRGHNAALPIGPFLGLQKLGVGGMGAVWLGRHVDSDTPAALKVVNAQIDRDDTAAFELFENEMRAVSALTHPNIVGLIDHGRAGAAAHALSGGEIRADSPYLALQYVRGGTLRRWIGRMSWSQIRIVLLSVLDALAHAHARGVLHLDIKPDNILLNDGGAPERGVRLTDFGLALLRTETRDGIAGTLEFMAPEQFLVGSTHGPWTDLYALGCLAWVLLTTAPPFKGKRKRALAELHTNAPLPAFRPTTAHPRIIESWLRKLLEKDPSKRYTRASDAMHDLWAIDAIDKPAMGNATPEHEVLPTRSHSAHSLLPTLGVFASTTVGRPRNTVGRVILPPTWKMSEIGSATVPDAGLSLVHEREPPLVGRTWERDRLWGIVRQVLAEQTPRLVLLRGALGSGRTAMFQWLASRTHEVGATETLWHDARKGLRDPEDLIRSMHTRRGNRVGMIYLDSADPTLPDLLPRVLEFATGALVIALRGPVAALDLPPTAEVVHITRLPDHDIRQMLSSVLPLDDGVLDALVTWSDGNPGLALGTLRQLARAGELRPSASGWSRPHGAGFAVPGPMAESVRRALTAIADSPGSWDALHLAAAFGNIVPKRRWRELATDLGDLGQRLVDACILELKGGSYRWRLPTARHLLTSEAANRLAHGRIAEHLAEQRGPPAVVARHFVSAHRYTDAHRPLLDAVAAAVEADDNELAAELYTTWTRVLDRLAISQNDPRRLAGRRFRSLIDYSVESGSGTGS